MKDEGTATMAAKKESSESSLLGRGRYKFYALAAILLLAFWSIFTGTVTLKWSAGNLTRFSEDINSPIREDLDVLVCVSLFLDLSLLCYSCLPELDITSSSLIVDFSTGIGEQRKSGETNVGCLYA